MCQQGPCILLMWDVNVHFMHIRQQGQAFNWVAIMPTMFLITDVINYVNYWCNCILWYIVYVLYILACWGSFQLLISIMWNYLRELLNPAVIKHHIFITSLITTHRLVNPSNYSEFCAGSLYIINTCVGSFTIITNTWMYYSFFLSLKAMLSVDGFLSFMS